MQLFLTTLFILPLINVTNNATMEIMKKEEFEKRCIAIFGKSWRVPFSNMTGIHRTTLYRCSDKGCYPSDMVRWLEEIEAAKDNITKNL